MKRKRNLDHCSTLDQRVDQSSSIILLAGEKQFESPISARLTKRKNWEADLDVIKSSAPRKRAFYGNSKEIDRLSFSLDHQNRLIEEFLESQKLDQKEEIVRRQKNVLDSSLTTDKKLAELGCLYFYLTRDLSLSKAPEQMSFLEARYHEISKRIHNRGNAQEFLPSGNVVDLMRPCVRLIFTPNGSFNPGGCSAVKLLLNSDLALVITEEMRAQILTIVNTLQTDDELFKLFLSEHKTIHPDAAELIRLDLFLSPDEAVGNLYASWAKLLAFFFVISQVNEENCFAFAITFDFIRQQPRFILRLFNHMIETGSLSFGSFEIPISLLIESRKRNEKEFDAQIDYPQAANLESISVIRSLFGDEEIELQEASTLRSIFSQQFPTKQAQAKQRYLAFKRNFFQQTILAFFQLVAINSMEEIDEHASFKEIFCHQIKDIIYYEFVESFPKTKEYKKFVKKFHADLIQRFIFIDHNNGEGIIEEKRIRFPHNSQGFLLDEQTVFSYQKFLNMRRLFYCTEGNFKPIDKLSDFVDCFIDSFRRMQDKEKWGDAPENFEKFINQNTFKEQSAKLIESCNYEENIDLPWETYHASDVFILPTNGGYPSHLLHWISLQENIDYEMVEVDGKTVEDLFLKLCGELRKYIDEQPLFLKQYNPTIPIDSSDHSFILYPLLFRAFISSDPNHLLEEKVNIPAQKLSERKPTVLVREQILFDAFERDFAQEILKLLPSEEHMPTMRLFYDAVARLLIAEESMKFSHSYEKILTQVTFEQFERHLPHLLSIYEIETTEEVMCHVKKSIAEQLPSKCPSFSLAQVADAINKALVINNLPYLSLYQLEDTLADLFELPYVIKLANLNWAESLIEAVHHKLLVLKFDLVRHCLVFYERYRDEERLLDESFAALLLKQFDLYLP